MNALDSRVHKSQCSKLSLIISVQKYIYVAVITQMAHIGLPQDLVRKMVIEVGFYACCAQIVLRSRPNTGAHTAVAVCRAYTADEVARQNRERAVSVYKLN